MSNVTLWARPAWDIDRWVRGYVGPAAANEWGRNPHPAGFHPAAEIARDGDDAVVRVELPGVDVENDVTVEVDKGQLVIRGERRDVHTEDNDGRTLSELRYGSFQRSFKLPTHVTGDTISASYDAGVLSVRVTGAHKGAEAQRIAIDSK